MPVQHYVRQVKRACQHRRDDPPPQTEPERGEYNGDIVEALVNMVKIMLAGRGKIVRRCNGAQHKQNNRKAAIALLFLRIHIRKFNRCISRSQNADFLRLISRVKAK